MIIKDGVYGEFEISEPVLLELIASPSIQRLKGISQMGMPQEYWHTPVFSRYEHSIGVMLILRKLNASINEQIAGLLHDVSHTAFSHVADWVFGDPTKEDHQDNIFEEFVLKSEIPGILEKNNISTKEILDFSNFPLLEQELPELCADRIDYTLRELNAIGKEALARELAGDLISFNSRIVFKSKELAESFANSFISRNNQHWAAPESRLRYYLLSDILKEAMLKEIISKEDFGKTDQEVLSAITLSKDASLLEKLKILSGKLKAIESDTGILLQKKFRYINPSVILGNQVLPLSSISPEYTQVLELERENSKK